MSKKERKTTSSKNDNGSDDSLKVEKHSDSQDRDDSEFIGLRIQTLKDRTRFLREPFEQDKLCYKTAFYLAEPGKHDITDYHQQPMKSENYPNSKKKHKLTNDDIYQDNNLQRGDPCLFFLKTDSTATKIYEEYYSSRSLFLLCSMRPLITSPRVFLTTKDGKPHILSEFIISNSV